MESYVIWFRIALTLPYYQEYSQGSAHATSMAIGLKHSFGSAALHDLEQIHD